MTAVENISIGPDGSIFLSALKLVRKFSPDLSSSQIVGVVDGEMVVPYDTAGDSEGNIYFGLKRKKVLVKKLAHKIRWNNWFKENRKNYYNRNSYSFAAEKRFESGSCKGGFQGC